jgi:nucleoside-diphosphate-sugar epimerase
MYARYFELDVRVLRWLNVYGPGQKAHPVRKAVPIMILQALHGRPIEVYGSGEQPVDLVYVDDLARVTVAYMQLESTGCETSDTGLTIRLTVNELAELIRRLTDSRSKIVHLPMRPRARTRISRSSCFPAPLPPTSVTSRGRQTSPRECCVRSATTATCRRNASEKRCRCAAIRPSWSG